MKRAAAGERRGRRPLVHHGVTLRCSRRLEDAALREGYLVVAGLDEVGRGALCGPVVAGAVVLGSGFAAGAIDDSKRLTARQREEQAERIRLGARAVGIGSADPAEIDRFDILRATQLAMKRALCALALAPDLVLVDGHAEVPGLGIPQRAIVKGDAISLSIAAASIVAKVHRDAIMRECDRSYPGYGLAHNMGYGSEDHRSALQKLGPCPIHRRSFQGTQPWLF